MNLCRLFGHPWKRIVRIRAHQQSERGNKHRADALCVDEHGCFVLLQCRKCGEVFGVPHSEL